MVNANTADCAPWIVSGASGAVASVLVAWPVSVNDPASRSAWVIAWVPVHTIDWFGANAATGIAGTHENPVNAGVSDTVTLCNVTLPVFLAVNV